MSSTAQHGPLYAPVSAEGKELRSAARVARWQQRLDSQTFVISVCAAFATAVAILWGPLFDIYEFVAVGGTAAILASTAFRGESARRIQAAGVGVLSGVATAVIGMYASVLFQVVFLGL
jgi:hypothetical protein